MFSRSALFLVSILVISATFAQAQRVSPYESHERVRAIVDRDGAGTATDPYRPKFCRIQKQKKSRT